MKSKTGQILMHIFGCLVFLSLPVLFSPDFGSEHLFSTPPFQKDFFNFVLLIGVFYISYYFLVPRFFFQKKYFMFVALVLAAYGLAAFLPHWLIPNRSFFRNLFIQNSG